MFTTIVSALHIFICVILVLIVLLQQGKGADMGATFGGSSNTLFGAAGADTFLTKVTTLLAALFMTTSVTLAIAGKSGGVDSGSNLFQNINETPEVTTIPAPPTSDGAAGTAAGAMVPPSAPAAAEAPASQPANGMVDGSGAAAPAQPGADAVSKDAQGQATQNTSTTAGK